MLADGPILEAKEASTEIGTSNLIMNIDFLIFLSLKHCRIYLLERKFRGFRSSSEVQVRRVAEAEG